jgi:hypothetical protein
MQIYTDCWEPSGGYPTDDGYKRVLTHPRSKGGKLKMWHRLVWEIVNGDIPEGHEINHLCKNRKCCNIDHLEMLTRSEHKSKDNAERYADVIAEGCEMLRNGYSPSEVALATSRKRTTVLSWIRKGWVDTCTNKEEI